MEINEILAILMFVAFIGLLFVGFPVAWTLGGIAMRDRLPLVRD